MEGFCFHCGSKEGDLEHHTRHCSRMLWIGTWFFSQHQPCWGFGVFLLGCISGEGTGKAQGRHREELEGGQEPAAQRWLEKQGEV